MISGICERSFYRLLEREVIVAVSFTSMCTLTSLLTEIVFNLLYDYKVIHF